MHYYQMGPGFVTIYHLLGTPKLEPMPVESRIPKPSNVQPRPDVSLSKTLVIPKKAAQNGGFLRIFFDKIAFRETAITSVKE